MANKPIHEIRRGLIKVRIWKRRSKSGTRHTVTITRLFRNGDEWKESSRYTQADLPLIRLLLDQAFTWMLLQAK